MLNYHLNKCKNCGSDDVGWYEYNANVTNLAVEMKVSFVRCSTCFEVTPLYPSIESACQKWNEMNPESKSIGSVICGDWRSIDQLPRDGEWVFISDGRSVIPCEYDSRRKGAAQWKGCACSSGALGGYGFGPLKYWMPFPKPPNNKG